MDRLGYRPVIAAFTATATRRVREDIIALLDLHDPFCLTTGFDRENLYFEVDTPPDKKGALRRFLEENRGRNGIVYCTTRKTVEEVCAWLQANGYAATRYHAGLPAQERQDNQDDFLYDRRTIMVATNAFGMGIDKSNVSFVIHYNMPGDIESYYQEAGRAGRDGQPAQCILYYSGQDVVTHQFLIEHGEENSELDAAAAARQKEQARERLKQMTFYCHTSDCLREYLLRYFGETPETYCGNCSNCLRHFEEADITEEARLIVKAIASTGQRFGVKMLVDILRGSKNARVVAGGFQKLPVYGALARVKESRLRAILRFLELRGYIRSEGEEYPVLRLCEPAKAIARGEIGLHMKAAREEVPAKPKRIRETAPVNPSLFNALRSLRAKFALKQGVPAYVVFSDATLQDMCARLPETREEMLEVSGVGQTKYAKYGKAFLEEIVRFIDENG